jgi:hypothetical protein
MKESKKQMLLDAGFTTEIKNVEAGLCPFCSKEINNDDFTDALSKKEFELSGMCQPCQDDFFK